MHLVAALHHCVNCNWKAGMFGFGGNVIANSNSKFKLFDKHNHVALLLKPTFGLFSHTPIFA